MQQHREELLATAKKMCAEGRGILAADESVTTLTAKFDKIGLNCSDENRRAYRELLITAPELEQYVSGIILFQETVEQRTAAGERFVDVLTQRGIVPGIKLDKGLVPLTPGSKEHFTRGMDDLNERAREFYEKGCRFAKWRCALRNDAEHPSPLAMRETAYTLARYAAVCQANGLVPIVEPELLSDGSWDIERGVATSTRVFAEVFRAMHEYGVAFDACFFKPHMVTGGSELPRGSAEEIARRTVDVLRATCPPAMAGIFFLSGGQSEKEATLNLQRIAQYAAEAGRPWHLSFSYGRALQTTVVDTWRGKAENVAVAQQALLQRARHNYNAVLGRYDAQADTHSAESSFQKDYAY
mgnify:CR=1 FL=1